MGTKCENVWKLLKTYDLQFETELPDDFKCVICKNVLINAHQSRCACKFCYECISTYLKEEEIFCPGGMEDCKEHKLNLKTDIHIDYIINKKISNLQVECPNSTCDLVVSLKDLYEHLKRDHLTDCPLSALGCSKINMSDGDMNDHLQTQYHQHTVMMIEYIDNLKDELASMKTKWSAFEANMCDKTLLKCEIQNIMKYIEETDARKLEESNRLKSSLDQCLIENLKLNTHLHNLVCDINGVKDDIQRLQSLMSKLQHTIGDEKGDFENSEFKNDLSQYKHIQKRVFDGVKTRKSEMKIISDNLEIKQKLVSELEKRTEELISKDEKSYRSSSKNDIEKHDSVKTDSELNYKIDKKELYRNMLGELFGNLKEPLSLYEINKMFNDVYDNKINDSNPSIEIQTTLLPAQSHKENVVPFDWKIDNFSKKWKLAREGIDPYIMSGDFYSYKNGYKMILGIYPDGFDTEQGSYLSVFFHIAKGEDDDKLSWPMKHELSISLINQETGCPHTTEKFKYETAEKSFLPSYHKPKSAINLGYGDTQFIDLLTLFNNKNLLKNDSIIIRCSMEISNCV